MMHHPSHHRIHHQPLPGHPGAQRGIQSSQSIHTHHIPPHQMTRESRIPMGHTQHTNSLTTGTLNGNLHHSSGPMPHQGHAMRPPMQHHSMTQMRGVGRGGYVCPNMSYGPPPSHHQPTRPHTTQGIMKAPAPIPVQEKSPVSQSTTNTNITISNSNTSTTSTTGTGHILNNTNCEGGVVVANSKEKTSMCLVNELARFNKIKHQYRLTSEVGPAHKKTFTVTLRLGDDEEYTAEGTSIKRAQHAAASRALAATSLPVPPPRPPHSHHHSHHRHGGSVMPTVELNALAMKLCSPAIYTAVPHAPGSHVPPPQTYRMHPTHLMPPYHQRQVHRVRLSVGSHCWIGEGGTPQAARHDAASRALHDLRSQHSLTSNNDTELPQDQDTQEVSTTGEIKSPVSLVHELALKRNLPVTFSVKSERGPPHMRVFITSCTVGELQSEGEGNGKKISKKKAAEAMLQEMSKVWGASAITQRIQQNKRTHHNKRKRNLIKENGETNGNNGSDNPISRLAAARSAARCTSPIYKLVEERGAARRREFVLCCEAPPYSALAHGPSKKIAKRKAAQTVLIAMGLESGDNKDVTSKTEDSKSSSKDSDKEQKIQHKTRLNNKSTESDKTCDTSPNVSGRQLVPGVLIMSDNTNKTKFMHNGANDPSVSNGNSDSSNRLSSKDELVYLSKLLRFSIQYSDFPKRNHGEYLTLVNVGSSPPVMCHGAGSSIQESHEECSRKALSALAEMGLDMDYSQNNSGQTTTSGATEVTTNGKQ